MIILNLTDDVESVDLELPEVPLTEETNNNDVEVTTLDNNISLFITPESDKRTWSHTWAYLSEDKYQILKDFRDRQRLLYKYPRLTIEAQDVFDVSVYMKLAARNTIDDCGEVQGVSITLRESEQMPEMGS